LAKFEAIKNGTNELKEIVYKEIIEYNIDLEQIEITKIAFGIILINHSRGKMANKQNIVIHFEVQQLVTY
jgi:hypothetical protein